MENKADADQNADDKAAATTRCSEGETKSSGQPQFLHKPLKWMIAIRMMDGRPIKYVFEACNNYELQLDLGPAGN